MLKQRILYWDVIKFFAIFLVVYGHTIQYLNPKIRLLWDSSIINVIYSFHMPLFMLVSGYFARSLFKKDIKEIIKNKFVQLVLTSVTTYIITGVILIFLRHTPVVEGFKILLGKSITSYWFLKALFIFYVLTSVLYQISKKNKLLAILSAALLLLLPTNILDYVHCISMYPYFIVGLLLYKCEKKFFHNKKLIMIVSALIYLMLSYFYHSRDYNMYDHHFDWNTEYLYLYVIRFIIGISASFVCIILIRKICMMFKGHKTIDFLAKIGTCTLGIYIFQQNFTVPLTYIVELVRSINPFRDTPWEFIYFDYIFCFILTITITAVCTIIVLVLRKTKYLRLILLGEKFN